MTLHRPSRETTGQHHQTEHKSLLQVLTIHNLSRFSNSTKFVEFLYLKYNCQTSDVAKEGGGDLETTISVAQT